MSRQITVIIVTRNRAEMLSGCLTSLCAQTLLPNEVVVVDNASEDDTKKVIFSFKNKLPIRYAYEQKIGIPYARNRGIKESSGSIILMLDDDCEAEKDWVKKMIDAHKKYPKTWVIQGRIFSLPKTGIYSLFLEFDRFFYLRKYSKMSLPSKSFFKDDFKEEMEFLTCNTKNFSVKTSYLKKYHLKFDENFCRGEDTDLGRQIIQKKGLIVFSPHIRVNHWERSTLRQFLKQRWHVGRTTARIAEKWAILLSIKLPRRQTILVLLNYCKFLVCWHKFPILLGLLYLDKLCQINGFSYEKKLLSLGRKRS